MKQEILTKKYNDSSKLTKKYKEYLSFIETRNAKFAKLPRNKRIVALCEDAIYNILNGFISPVAQNAYINGLGVDCAEVETIDALCSVYPKSELTAGIATDGLESYLKDKQLQTILPFTHCDVCAKGALMISGISFKNNFTYGKVIEKFDDYNGELPKLLKDDFEKQEWQLIEICFEGWSIYKLINERANKLKITHPIFKDIKFDSTDNKILKSEFCDDYGEHTVFYGQLFYLKYFQDDYGYYGKRFFGKENRDIALLLHIYCSIIANNGNVIKALDISSKKVVDHKAIISKIAGMYPLFKTKQELNKEIKPLLSLYRKNPLSVKDIKAEIEKSIYVFINTSK